MTIDRGDKSPYTGYWETVVNSEGHPFRVWRHIMPRIPDEVLNCSVYLYPTVEDASDGANYGGSGFLVGLFSKVFPSRPHLYVVTNSHVIRRKSHVIRLSTAQGDTVIIDCQESEWTHHPDGDDVAIYHLHEPQGQDIDVIPAKVFISPEIIEKESIGAGDEIFMIGRFIGHDGKQRNLPSVRFGNLSMMPDEPLYNEDRGINQESFIVETRSLSGYSGSPVLVYDVPWFPRPGRRVRPSEIWTYLLGIDWCHISRFSKVLESDKKTHVSEKTYVETNSGMAGVVPAWKIMELINMEESMIEKEERKEKEEHPDAPVLDSATGQGISKQDFESQSCANLDGKSNTECSRCIVGG